MADFNERYILGLPEMDEQHNYLYSLFDALERNTTVTDSAATKRLLDELERYIMFHFSSEEFLMRSYSVPSYSAHQSDHETAANRFIKFVDDFDAGCLNPAALRIFLTGWLMEHSQTIDADYVAHIKKCRKGLV